MFGGRSRKLRVPQGKLKNGTLWEHSPGSGVYRENLLNTSKKKRKQKGLQLFRGGTPLSSGSSVPSGGKNEVRNLEEKVKPRKRVSCRRAQEKPASIGKDREKNEYGFPGRAQTLPVPVVPMGLLLPLRQPMEVLGSFFRCFVFLLVKKSFVRGLWWGTGKKRRQNRQGVVKSMKEK